MGLVLFIWNGWEGLSWSSFHIYSSLNPWSQEELKVCLSKYIPVEIYFLFYMPSLEVYEANEL